MNKNLKPFLLVFIVVVLAGCAAQSDKAPPVQPPAVESGPQPVAKPEQPPVHTKAAPPMTAKANGGPRHPLETGRSFLVGEQAEEKGYGLYSYLIFGSPPSDATHARYLRAIEAYLEKIPLVKSLEKSIPRHELNVTYLPLDSTPPSKVLAEWVLEHYNYARARVLLRAIGGSHRDGPYILSFPKPLSSTETVSGNYLHQDLSSVPPDLVQMWVTEFLNQAAEERFGEENKGEQIVLKLRTSVGTLAQGLPPVRKALDEWIVWIREKREPAPKE